MNNSLLCRRRSDRVPMDSTVLARAGRDCFDCAQLIDLGDQGACLEGPAHLASRDQVHLYLRNRDRFVTLIGRVAWSRELGGDRVLVGLELDPVPCDRVAFGVYFLSQLLVRAQEPVLAA